MTHLLRLYSFLFPAVAFKRRADSFSGNCIRFSSHGREFRGFLVAESRFIDPVGPRGSAEVAKSSDNRSSESFVSEAIISAPQFGDFELRTKRENYIYNF